MAGIQAKQLDPSVPLGPWSWAGGQDGPLDISGAYSQTGDVYASTLRLRAGALWSANNFRIFCLTPVEIDAGAILACDGVNGSASSVGGAAGIAVVFGTLGQGFNGGAGGLTSQPGSPGGARRGWPLQLHHDQRRRWRQLWRRRHRRRRRRARASAGARTVPLGRDPVHDRRADLR